MKLKAQISKLDEVDAAYHSLYEQKGDVYVLLPIEGMKPETEFNTVHTALGKEREDHRKTKADLATAKTASSEATAKVTELQAIVDAGGGADIAKQVEARVSQQVAPLQRKLAEAENAVKERDATITKYEAKARADTIGAAISAACGKSDVRDTAISDAVMLGSSIFEIQDGVPITRADVAGVTPGISPDVWLAGLKDSKPHWFKESSGGGAANGGQRGVVNPWTAAHWNLTEQGKVLRQDPSKAEQMAKAAGSSIGATSAPTK